MSASPNEQVSDWLDLANEEQLRALADHLYETSLEASVLTYKWVVAHPLPLCHGSGRRWHAGRDGNPYCPVCRLGPSSIGAVRPEFRNGKWGGSVPTHFAD